MAYVSEPRPLRQCDNALLVFTSINRVSLPWQRNCERPHTRHATSGRRCPITAFPLIQENIGRIGCMDCTVLCMLRRLRIERRSFVLAAPETNAELAGASVLQPMRS
jgi:hypothetical protein